MGYVDGMSNNTQNATVEYIYHEHTEACKATCTFKTICFRNEDGYGITVSHHSCNSNSNGTWYYGGNPPWIGEKWITHTYYLCGKTESTIESAIITFQ